MIKQQDAQTTRARWLPWALALVSAASLGAQSSSGTGAISGTVRDPSGAGVAAASVVVSHEDRGVRREIVTAANGSFQVLGLPPAPGYVLTVSFAGFADQEYTGVEVETGEETALDITMDLSPRRTRVVVEESIVVADRGSAGVSQVIHESQILNLPINGRRVDSYVLLTPAVVPDGSTGLVSFRGIAGGNAFLTDGNDTSNQFFHENAGRTRISAQISQDAVQEFQVLSTGYSAEYGRASGGIINTVTRSGSNRTAGTAYWFYRNRAMTARDPYATVKPPEERHQAGASLGGKLIPDKLFYFFNGEIHRRDFPIVSSLSRPPLFGPDGRFRGTCGATAQQCAAALAFLGRNFGVLERTSGSELGFGRIDWRPSEMNAVSASFNYLRWASPNGYQTQSVLNNGEAFGANGNSSVRTRYGRLAWTATPNARWINELRFGWFKDRHADDLPANLIPAATGPVQISIEGQLNLGVLSEVPRLNPSENRFQLAENITWSTGQHTLRAGADIIRTQEYLRYLRNRNGTYDYADFTSFARDFTGNTTGARRWQAYSQRFGREVFDQTIGDYNFYVQNQHRLLPNVTLNYGVRYEYSHLPQPETGSIPTIATNFAPRIGLAAGLNHSRTVLRTGYGIFYARYPGGVLSTLFLENGTYQRSIQLERRFLSDQESGPVFPNRLPPSAASSSALAGLPTDLTMASPDYRNPYTQQGDIGIDHAVSSSLSINASYIWSRGLHLTTVRDSNIGRMGAPIYYSIEDAAGKEVGEYATPSYRLINRINPDWRRINLIESGGNSYYNGLAVQVRRRMRQGWEGFASYTWSHAIDFNQGGGADNIFFSEGPRTLNNGDYRAEKASSQLDQRHRLVVSSTWEAPGTGTGRLQRLLKGWRFSQISTFASSQPATAVVFVSGVPFPGAAFNTTLNGFGGSPRVPFFPASGLDIDTVARTDARLARVIPLKERLSLHLNLEAFNLLNHVSNTAVNTLAYEAKGGVLRPMPGLGQGVESQGYPDGTNARRLQISMRLIW